MVALTYILEQFQLKEKYQLGITVGRQDIKSECAAVLAKLSKKDGYHDGTNNNDLSKYEWLIDWMNKQYI